MDALASDAKRFVHLALRSIVVCFSVVVISLMTMIKPAQASGAVEPMPTDGVYADAAHTRPISGYSSTGAITSANHSYPYATGLTGVFTFTQACVTDVLASVSSLVVGWSGPGYLSDAACYFYKTTAPPPAGSFVALCPAHSTGTPAINPTSCTCTDPYVPDPTGKICVLEQYTLSLKTDPLEKIEPSGSATVIATVVDAHLQPKDGVQVSIRVDVDAGSGGHDHDAGRHVSPYTGTLDATTRNTGSDGTVSFTFGAPAISGTHTITAECVSPTCTNNPVTTTINVKVDGLAPISPSMFYALYEMDGSVIGAVTGRHPSNHYLTPEASNRLLAVAINYHFLFPRDLVLHLNDASLVWGGVFDTKANWQAPHSEHERGTVIDIRANATLGNVPFNNFKGFDKMATKLKKVDAQIHCTSNRVDHQGRTGPDCIGSDGSQDSNRHYHIRLMGVAVWGTLESLDTTPPSLTVSLSPATLWPPNEKLVPVTAIITVKDDYDPSPEIQLISIMANEVLDKDDVKGALPGTDDRQFMLKADREGRNKAGRIYTVTYSATDGSGNKTTTSTTVTVPHDQGK